mmetsp:Transcript_7066/g.15210  ORF Transcript_7066/g.15210 Transcript_7066/m.15210 type:complete len:225 (-) Transcript_7066:283-957(-)
MTLTSPMCFHRCPVWVHSGRPVVTLRRATAVWCQSDEVSAARRQPFPRRNCEREGHGEWSDPRRSRQVQRLLRHSVARCLRRNKSYGRPSRRAKAGAVPARCHPGPQQLGSPLRIFQRLGATSGLQGAKLRSSSRQVHSDVPHLRVASRKLSWPRCVSRRHLRCRCYHQILPQEHLAGTRNLQRLHLPLPARARVALAEATAQGTWGTLKLCELAPMWLSHLLS